MSIAELKQRIAEIFDPMDRIPLTDIQMGNLLKDCLSHIEEQEKRIADMKQVGDEMLKNYQQAVVKLNTLEKRGSLIPMPEGIDQFNASNERCDMLQGPCSCGATHSIAEWFNKLAALEKELLSKSKELHKVGRVRDDLRNMLDKANTLLTHLGYKWSCDNYYQQREEPEV